MAVQAVVVGRPRPVELVVQAVQVEQAPRVVGAAVAQATVLELHQPPELLEVYILVQLVQMDHRPR
jgi:hypothetical protein